jgi:hypothetical protein
MPTFRFLNITQNPSPVDNRPFDFIIELDCNGAKAIRFTFTLPRNSPYVFTHRGTPQKSFSETRSVPDKRSTQRIPAQLGGPAGRVRVRVNGTNTSDPQDRVPSGTVVIV